MDGDIADRSILLECMDLPQIACIVDGETARRIGFIAPFWRSPLASPKDCLPRGDEMHSAARRASTEMLGRFYMW